MSHFVSSHSQVKHFLDIVSNRLYILNILHCTGSSKLSVSFYINGFLTFLSSENTGKIILTYQLLQERLSNIAAKKNKRFPLSLRVFTAAIWNMKYINLWNVLPDRKYHTWAILSANNSFTFYICRANYSFRLF